MLKIDMEVKRGILFIRLNGILNKVTTNKFNNEVLPVVLDNGLKYVVINLDKVNYIDTFGIEALKEVGYIVTNLKGKTTLCSLTNNQVKLKLEETDGLFYEASNELTALGVMKI